MPSALETLVKILKLEQDTSFKNTAVIGGLQTFAKRWAIDAHQQAKRPEHHQLVDEMTDYLYRYEAMDPGEERYRAIKYMLGRIMGRIDPPDDLPPSRYVENGAETKEHPARSAPPPGADPSKEYETSDQDDESSSAASSAQTTYTLAENRIGESATDDVNLDSEDSEAEDEDDSYTPALPVAPRPPKPRRKVTHEKLSRQQIQERLDTLRQPVTVLPKVGEKMAEKLAIIGVTTILDLLYLMPRRYDDYTNMKTLNRLAPGETVTVLAAVRSIIRKQGRGGRPYLLMAVDDGTRVMNISFFGQPWLQRQFKRGSQVVFSGKVDVFRGELMMTNPEWEMLERENLHTNRIVPVYPLTKGLSARTLRRMVRQTIDKYAAQVPDHLPESVADRTEYPELSWCLEQLHFPDSFEELNLAKTRLSFDELLIFHMAMLRSRRQWQAVPGDPIQVTDEWLDEFISSLPYPLTGAQQRVLSEIRSDISRDIPMNRLLQGDVGSGKTIVAATAMAMTVQAGKQTALMAPTSILAEQHARSLAQTLGPAGDRPGIEVRLLTGNTSDAERQEIYQGLRDGTIRAIVGTHALIQHNVDFQNLGLIIVDEQHRFGVEQRGILRDKGTHPHALVMTATPIPRTLALTLFADLDLSIIDEMPPGRTPVQTRILHPQERQRAHGFIQSQINQGRQAFIVYPLVESSDVMEELGSAVENFEVLQNELFARYRVGLLHGRMTPDEKERVMETFAQGEIDLLVSTSVVEVGIDVPNASVILIENAERFGLAQLHQFRGRVGRGEHKSFCLLVTESTKPEAEQRLKAMEETTDGFQLAEIDWKMRGSGDLMGLRQSGASDFKLAEIMNAHLVELAQREARTIYAEDPDLQADEHWLLAFKTQRQFSTSGDIS